MIIESGIPREYIKKKLFPVICETLGEFIDFNDIDINAQKIFLPTKKKVNTEQLKIKEIFLRKKLQETIKNSNDLKLLIKENFAKSKNLHINDIEESPWVPFDSRINLPIKYTNPKKKIAGVLDWHQDTGSWYNYDLQKKNHNFIKKDYWKLITYSNWVPICDCNRNGIQIIENSDYFGLQNIKERLVNLRDNRYYFNYSIINKQLKDLSVLDICPKAGDIVCFNSLIFHRSMINHSNEIRCSFEFRFILKKKEYVQIISKKILLKRFLLKNYPFIFKLLFFPTFFYSKFFK